MSQGRLFQSATVDQMAREFPRKSEIPPSPEDRSATSKKTPRVSVVSDGTGAMANSEDAGAVVFLFPPKQHFEWSLARFWIACKLWFLEYVNLAQDKGCKATVCPHDDHARNGC